MAKQSNFLLIPQVDQWPRLVQRAEDPLSQILLILISTAILALMKSDLDLVFLIPLLALFARPESSHFFLAISSVMTFLVDKSMSVPSEWLTFLGSGLSSRTFLVRFNALGLDFEFLAGKLWVLALGLGLFYLFRRNRRVIFGGSAIIGLCCTNAILYLAASSPWLETNVRAMIWLAIVYFNRRLFWALAYIFSHRKQLRERPFYWSLPVITSPFSGKSHAYLERFRAKDSRTLAICRLKAVKLTLWIGFWAIVVRLASPLLKRSGWDFLPFPEFLITDEVTALYYAFLKGEAVSRLQAWWAVLLTFGLDMIILTIVHDTPVILFRLFGFCAPRGIYRPFESRSLADFFARRYYYYKELLFDLFVMPIFLKTGFIKDRKLRTFTAIFLGVGFGSTLTHLLIEIPFLQAMGLGEFFLVFLPMILRSFFFGLVIGLHQYGNPMSFSFIPWPRLAQSFRIILIFLFFALAKLFAPIMLT
ncbi:MAG: hypothetical protein AB7F86_13150, partial [Bdellovibrionales bacterium]